MAFLKKLWKNLLGSGRHSRSKRRDPNFPIEIYYRPFDEKALSIVPSPPLQTESLESKHQELDAQASLAPQPLVLQLPDDLLGSIFEYYIEDSTHNPRDGTFSWTDVASSLKATRASKTSPITLGHVCSHWRKLTFSIPNLWSSITIFKPTMSKIPAIEFWLERASDCPLSIALFSNETSEHVATKQVLSLLLTRAHLWKHLELQIHAAGVPHTELLSFGEGVTTRLESVNLQLIESTWEHAFVDQIWRNTHSLPTLRRVFWDSQYVADSIPTHAPWAQLTHISINNKWSKWHLKPSSFLKLIQKCQDLISLDFNIDEYWDVPFNIAPFTLPNLRDLRIQALGFVDASALLSRLILPSLTSLELSYSPMFLPSGAHLVNWIKDLLARSSCQLQRLSLWYWAMSEDEFLDLFSSAEMQQLAHFDIKFGSMPEWIVKRLMHIADDPRRTLPDLATLALPPIETSDVARAVDMIKSRVLLSSTEGRSTRCDLCESKLALKKLVFHCPSDFSLSVYPSFQGLSHEL
ncbi:hypothetical protein Hypma_010796 [Hypsizygus marmoreus]|uniref:F-box domain-containing protein n=1 Tax=Hypsizygus marmoreus TaxID=39966 RepID=A0A369JKT1_HYPMA|nr:hypothetical protein Hypma_010796 [Hypsizygus marmoreus]